MIEDYSYEYWKMLLEDADNASSDNNRIIYALVDAFGKDVVFSKKPFISTDTINYKIFDILNEHMFDSSLKRIKILYMTASEITAYMNVEFERQNVEDKANIEHYKDSIGIYSCTMDYDHSLPEPRCYETLYFTENEEMFINKDVLSTKSFMFTVATICHEMIHYYDRLNGDEYLQIQKYGIITGKKKNDHFTYNFMNKKKEANELGIGVFNSGKDVDQYTIDDELIKKALSLIEEGNEEYSFPTSQSVFKLSDGTIKVMSID